MKESFRQSMTWLHTWTGLVVGWVLFFVFVTGTASYATQEITRWMQPERPLKVTDAPEASKQFDIAYQKLRATPESHQANNWNITLVNDGRNSTQLTASWSMPAAPGERRGRTESIQLDANSGEIIEPAAPPRQTAGGRALLRMHYALHYIPYDKAILIVGICTMFMFIAIITGVIAHKKIFKDFFTFRHSKGLRSWLDAHNVISVAALPFYLMITYSGFIFFLYVYMPLAVPLTYGFEPEDEQAYYTELAEQTGSTRIIGRGGGGGATAAAARARQAAQAESDDMNAGVASAENNTVAERTANSPARNRGDAGARPESMAEGNSGGATAARNRGNSGERSEGRGNRGERQQMAGIGQQSEHFTDLSAIVARMEQEWGNKQIRSVTIHPATDSNVARIQFARAFNDTVRRRGSGSFEFNAITGERIASSLADSPAPEMFGSTMLGLHEGLFAGPLVRWLYLLSGVLGSAMIATGLVLWTVKRRPKLVKTGEYAFAHGVVEKLNVATVAGLPFALAVYFWSNRLLPVGIEGRNSWEIHSMFITWGLISLYSVVRPVMPAWREVLGLTAVAWLLLPILNAITTDRHLLVTIPHGDWVLASVDLSFIGVGLMFAWAALKVHRKMLSAETKRARKDRPEKPEATARTTERPARPARPVVARTEASLSSDTGDMASKVL